MKAVPSFFCLLFLTASSYQSSASVPLGVDIVRNGDFEVSGTHYDFPPWQFGGTSMRAIINEGWPRTASGRNCIYISGQVWQDLETEIGQAYRLSYYERGDDQPDRYSLLTVLWGDQVVGTHVRSNAGSAWYYQEVTVVAVSTTTRLTFWEASGTIGSYGQPKLDLVKAVSVIPEPTTLSLLGLGSLALVMGRRRR